MFVAVDDHSILHHQVNRPIVLGALQEIGIEDHAGAEIDLLIDRGSERVGFEFKAGVATDASDWKQLLSGIDDGVTHRGMVVYSGSRTFEPHAKISVMRATRVLVGGLD